MGEYVIVKTNVKKISQDFIMSSDFADALDEKVKSLIRDAMDRASSNGRKTLRPKDL